MYTPGHADTKSGSEAKSVSLQTNTICIVGYPSINPPPPNQSYIYPNKEPTLDHIHLRQDLGDPGYACPTCPQEILPAPTFYPPLGESPNFGRISALQRQLDTFWQSGTHARHQLDLVQRGVEGPERPRIPVRTRTQIRAEIRRLVGILARTRAGARNVQPLLSSVLNPVTAFRGEFVPGVAWRHNNLSRRQALRFRAVWISQQQTRPGG